MTSPTCITPNTFLNVDHKPEEMEYEPEEVSAFLVKCNVTLSSQALCTLRVMAFLGPRYLHDDLLNPLRRVFAVKNRELMFDFPVTAATCTAACAELAKASLIQLSRDGKTYYMSPSTQTNVLTDAQATGLIPPLFNAIVKVLAGLWPRMICIPDRTLEEREYTAATAAGTEGEAYLERRHYEDQMPQVREYCQYAGVNIWGRRDKLVCHIARLQQIFPHLAKDMIATCATDALTQLLMEAAWYHWERSRHCDAEATLQAALGVCGHPQRKSPPSSLYIASIHRIHAAIAIERGNAVEAAQHVGSQLQQLAILGTSQREALKKSGLLDRAPDSVALSSWGLDLPPGNSVVLPFRSVCSFGWKLYEYSQCLDTRDEEDAKLAQTLLRQAARCFSTVLHDRTSAHPGTGQMSSRTGEIYYALGNITRMQAIFLGKALLNESLEWYEKALLHFQGAVTDSYSVVGIAKTHYKLAEHPTRRRDLKRAIHHLDEAKQFYSSNPAYDPHLARVIFQQSILEAMTGDKSAKSTALAALAIRCLVRPEENRFAEDLSEADFDELVGIWER